MAARLPQDELGLEASFPTASQEKACLESGTTVAHGSRLRSERMSSTRRMLTLLVVGLLVTFGLATAIAPKPWNYGPCHTHDNRKAVAPAAGNGDSSFSQLLNGASQDSLHDLLHRYFPKTYRHGVYPSDASAIEAVHKANAALASSLVRMARRDNTTTTTTVNKPPPPPTQTTTTTTTDAPPTDTNPPPAGTTDSPPPSSTDNPPDTTTSSTTQAMTSPGTSAAASPAPSSKPVTSTYTSVVNGTPTVVVATSYVAVSPQDATTTRPNGSLQTNAAAGNQRAMVMEAVVGAVIGGAMLL